MASTKPVVTVRGGMILDNEWIGFITRNYKAGVWHHLTIAEQKALSNSYRKLFTPSHTLTPRNKTAIGVGYAPVA